MLGSARFSFSSILLVVLVALLLAVAAPVLAAEIHVDGTCTLREAIASANRDSGRGGCEAGDGDDVIILTRDSKPGQGQLSRIRTTIVIEGNNHMLELDNDHAAFKIDDGDLTVRNLKIVYYDNTRTRKSFEVYNGKLTLIKVTVKNCEVGVQQDSRSHTTIKSNSDICGLPHNMLVTGGQSFDIDLPVPLPAQTCATRSGGATVTATYGLASGLQCNQVGASGIGIQSVIEAGFIDAVDVWGYVEQGVEICFSQLGSLTFLDAATSPRAVSTIQSYNKGGQTCTHLTRAGTVVLVPGAPSVAGPSDTAQPVTTTTTATGTVVSGCPITATGHLKFLDSPSSDAEIVGYITRGTTMSFVSRVVGWYQVSHNGQTAWVGGKYTAGGSSC